MAPILPMPWACARPEFIVSERQSGSTDTRPRRAMNSSPLYNGDRLEGRYANYFKVGHNAFELLLDFGQFFPEGEPEQLHTRIITTPSYAKVLLDVLRDSIERYEQSYGPIQQEE